MNTFEIDMHIVHSQYLFIAQIRLCHKDLTRLPSKTNTQIASGQGQVDKDKWTRKPLQQCFIYVYPALLRYLSIFIFKHIHVASIYSTDYNPGRQASRVKQSVYTSWLKLI